MRYAARALVLVTTAIWLWGDISLAQRRPYWEDLETITVEEAEEAAGYSGGLGPVRLNELKSLSPNAAKALAKHRASLYLGGLNTISDATARELAQHQGDLFLDGLTSLSASQAKELSHTFCTLNLNGVKELSDEAIAALADSKATLSLGINKLSDIGASALAQHKGGLYLKSLYKISPKGLEALLSHQGTLDISGYGTLYLAPETLVILDKYKRPGLHLDASVQKELSGLKATTAEQERLAAARRAAREKEQSDRAALARKQPSQVQDDVEGFKKWIEEKRSAEQMVANKEKEKIAAADLAAQAEHERVVAAIAAKAKQDQAPSSAKKSKNWSEWAFGAASSENEKVVGPVESWNRFVDAAKGRATAVEAKWKEDHPEGSRRIKLLSDDVKKTDSLKSPFRGEILLSVVNNFGPNLGRQLLLDSLDKSKSFHSALQHSYFEQGDQREADRMLKELKDIESRRREVLKQDISMISGYEYQLRFAFTNGSWVFVDGEQKVTHSCTGKDEVGKTARFNELQGNELEIFK